MSKPRAGTASDAELGIRILAGWERMSRAVPDGPRHNRRLAEHFGVAVRDIEHVRDIRNAVAHPAGPIARADLERAVAIIRRAGRRRTAAPPKRARPASATPRTNRRRTPGPAARSSGRSRSGRSRGGKGRKGGPTALWGRAADLRMVWLFIGVLAVGVVVFVVLSY